eukprot:TRINITY_DN36_c0_g1_i1.p1 TRINITY_DN36_c0_g1~~TRINITY_DN36_c0_g1_i1.p1  ORF type:complete len:226 (-),score=71.09 TRINITY_DN36_c0_g1_i1:92-769(-)
METTLTETALVNSEVIRSRKQNAPEIEEEIRNTVQKLSSYFPKMDLAHIQAVYVFYQRDLAQALEILEREYDALYNNKKTAHSSDEDYNDDDDDDDVDEEDSEDEQPIPLQNVSRNVMSNESIEGLEMISRIDRQAAALVTDMLARSSTFDKLDILSSSDMPPSTQKSQDRQEQQQQQQQITRLQQKNEDDATTTRPRESGKPGLLKVNLLLCETTNLCDSNLAV